VADGLDILSTLLIVEMGPFAATIGTLEGIAQIQHRRSPSTIDTLADSTSLEECGYQWGCTGYLEDARPETPPCPFAGHTPAGEAEGGVLAAGYGAVQR
jgi:hypothetical protein